MVSRTAETIHTCSYSCERPECIRAQRDELAARLTAAQQQGGWGLDDVVCLACGDPIMPMGQLCHACSHPVSAPPSAPVGVEGLYEEVASAIAYIRFGDEDAPEWDGQRVRVSLAQQPAACDMGELCIGCEPRNADGSCPDQQPAAVDEAMVERIMSEFHANDPGDVWPPDEQGRLRRKALQDAINNALATQHQEPTT